MPSRRGEALLDDERLAEDAGRLGQRHRQSALQRRAVRRAWCCGRRGRARGRWSARSRRCRDQLRNTSERSSTNGMQNAPPRLPSRGPASIHRSSTARSTRPPSGGLYALNAPRTMSRPSSQRRLAPVRTGSGANRSHHGSAPPCAVQPGLGAHPAPEVGQRRRRRPPAWRRTWRRLDAVGEQRRVERARPAAAAVHDVGLALDGVHRRGARARRPWARPPARRRTRPGAPLGRRAWRGRGPPPSAAARRCRRGTHTSAASCDVTSECRRSQADEPVGAELGVEAFLGLGHLVRRRGRRGAAAGRRARRAASLTAARASAPPPPRAARAPSRRGGRAAG